MSEAVVVREPVVLSDLPSPVFRGAQMVAALAAYRELQKALDAAMPDQVMTLAGKPFRKKGYWRAIRVAFDLSVEPIEEHREVSGVFGDGRENFGHVVMYRATSSGGRYATGDGSCFAVEKARRFKCPHPIGDGSKRTVHFPHESCPDYDPAEQWKTLPAQATEHNVRSHAHTRAFNRAVSNLVGFGEVSAEEVERDEHETETPAVEKRADGAALVTAVDTKTGTGKNNKPWTMYLIAFDDGRSGSTFDAKLAEQAQTAQKADTLLIPTLEQRGQYWNLIGLAPVESATASGDPPPPTTGGIINENQVRKFNAVATGHGWGEAERHELLSVHGFTSSKEITVAAFNGLLDELKQRQPK